MLLSIVWSGCNYVTIKTKELVKSNSNQKSGPIAKKKKGFRTCKVFPFLEKTTFFLCPIGIVIIYTHKYLVSQGCIKRVSDPLICLNPRFVTFSLEDVNSEWRTILHILGCFFISQGHKEAS